MAKSLIRPLRSESEYERALDEVERLFEKEPKLGSQKAERFQRLLQVIGDYEDQNWPIKYTSLSADAPITNPSQDVYGLDPFAKTIARSIEKVRAPDGIVYAIHGPWGSGKSSAINLIQHYLQAAVEDSKLQIVVFNPWWFSGAESLALAFFREMGAAIGKSVSKKAAEALLSIGRRIAPASPLLGAVANLTTGGSSGALASGAVSLFGELSKSNRTIDQEYGAVSESLIRQERRFLVVIDDIDRLNPDDALLVFRLIKSVGRLPNVIYLLAFDRKLAEKAVFERFPSEGPHYLEKILQAPFELPAPSGESLRNLLLSSVEEIAGPPSEDQIVRYMNIFYDAVVPFVRTPRDVVRLTNALRVTWPTIEHDVDRADFLAIEALRLFAPSVHSSIRQNAIDLWGDPARDGRDQNKDREKYDSLLLADIQERDREQYRVALMRLFPRLQSAWRNTWYTEHDHEWRRQRLISSKEHFGTYFSFSVGQDTLPASELNDFIKRASDRAYIQSKFRQYLSMRRSNGKTKAALALDELIVHAKSIESDDVPTLIASLFEIADELDVAADQAGAFSIGDNPLRMHWLLNRAVVDRFNLEDRSDLLLKAAKNASLGWVVDFASRALRALEPDENKNDPSEPVVDRPTADALRDLALDRIRAGSRDGTLAGHHRLIYLLFRWKELSAKGASEVHDWTGALLEDDSFVLTLAKRAVGEGWSHSMGFAGLGDRVAKRTKSVRLDQLRDLFDTDRFLGRIGDLAKKPGIEQVERTALTEFLKLSERSGT